MNARMLVSVGLALATTSACGGPAVHRDATEAKSECLQRLGAPERACELIGTPVESKRQMSLGGVLTDVPPTGGAVLVDFWAVNCEPCRRAMPELQREWEAGVPVLGVSLTDNPGTTRDTALQWGARYPILIDDGRLRGAFRVGGEVPRLFVVDAGGVVRGVFGGADGEVARAVALYRAVRE